MYVYAFLLYIAHICPKIPLTKPFTIMQQFMNCNSLKLAFYIPLFGWIRTLTLFVVRLTAELLVESRRVNTSQSSGSESSMISISRHCRDLIPSNGSKLRVEVAIL